jgi:subtilisin family serine protease
VCLPYALQKPDVCQVQTGTTWGLVRIAEEELRIDGVYNYDDTMLAPGVTAYIIDTGVYVQHSDFERRARGGVSFIAGEPADTDGNGHGTHVAGTTAGTKWGIAKEAEIVGVKVLSEFGSGSTDGVISGIQWTCTDHTRDNNKCVSNLSLGGGLSPAMNAAIDALYDCGCSVVCASGNNGRDACMGSPGAADYCYTVNAMDNQDNHASFSNYGQCTQM